MRYATVNDAAGQHNKNRKQTIQDTLSNIYFRVQKGMITEEGFVEQVEAAYEKAGYVTPKNAEKTMKMVNQMANFANDMAHVPTIQYVVMSDDQRFATPVCSGQEWYDRFEKEANSSTHYVRSLFREGWPTATRADDREMFVKEDILEAAKRAAGIEVGDE